MSPLVNCHILLLLMLNKDKFSLQFLAVARGVDVRLDAEEVGEADRRAQHRVAPRAGPHVQVDALRRGQHALLGQERPGELRDPKDKTDVSRRKKMLKLSHQSRE